MMKARALTLLLFVTVAAPNGGCGTAPDAMPASTTTVPVDASAYQLLDEPDGAVGVMAARESARNGAPLVLVGRVGGSANPWIEGRAAFTLLDASITIVAAGADCAEGEVCSGDCCATERVNCTTLVKVVDPQGQLVQLDSRDLLGLKAADLVVVQGTAQKDDHGNFVVLARGVFVRK